MEHAGKLCELGWAENCSAMLMRVARVGFSVCVEEALTFGPEKVDVFVRGICYEWVLNLYQLVRNGIGDEQSGSLFLV